MDSQHTSRFEIIERPVSASLKARFPDLPPVIYRVFDHEKRRYVPFSNSSDPDRAQRILARIRAREGER